MPEGIGGEETREQGSFKKPRMDTNLLELLESL